MLMGSLLALIQSSNKSGIQYAACKEQRHGIQTKTIEKHS